MSSQGIAYGYVRVSTDEQAESGLGIEAQKTAIIALAERQGLHIDDWFSDNGMSGGSDLKQRDGLMACIDMVKPGTSLLVARRDRLARGMLLICIIEKQVEKRGGRVISAAGEGTNDNDPTSVMTRRFFDMLAEYELLMIRWRTKMALLEKKRRCERIGRHIPYGFAPDPKSPLVETRQHGPMHSAYVVCPEEQRVIRLIRGMRQRGTSLFEIAMTLTGMGIPTRAGTRWNKTMIHRILKRFPLDTNPEIR